MRRTKEQAAETRQTILQAADALFVERGFDGVSLDEIAAAAGVKRGAVHFHFVNKPGVLIAICETEKLPLQQLVERLGHARATSVLDDLRAVMIEAMRSFEGDRRRQALLRGMMTIGLKLDDEGHLLFVAFQRKLHQLIFELLDEAASKGQLAAAWTARTAALALHSCVTGLLLQWVTKESDVKLFPDGAEVVGSLVTTFGAKPAPKKSRSQARRRR